LQLQITTSAIGLQTNLNFSGLGLRFQRWVVAQFQGWRMKGRRLLPVEAVLYESLQAFWRFACFRLNSNGVRAFAFVRLSNPSAHHHFKPPSGFFMI
jgi:hypothetical protein